MPSLPLSTIVFTGSIAVSPPPAQSQPRHFTADLAEDVSVAAIARGPTADGSRLAAHV